MAETYKRRLGDRVEGRRIRSLDPIHQLMAYIMVKKNDACNYFTDSIEITEIERYLRKLRMNGYPGIGMLHVLLATYTRMVSRYPGVNRFIAGQRVYARHDVELVMMVKTEMKIDSPETSIKVPFGADATLFDIYTRFNEQIESVKNANETKTDDIAKIFAKIPGLFLKFAIWLMSFLDYFGIMPKAVLEASPFHGSVIITDLGSIGLPPIYHHIYNFGTMPLFICMGPKRKVNEVQTDGSVIERKYIDVSFVMDERTVDGFYFSQVYRYFRSILRNPVVLETPPEEVLRDVD